MPTATDGGEPVEVPLAYYDADGERHVVGKAAIQIKNGEMIALGQIDYGGAPPSEYMRSLINSMNIEGFSLSVGPMNGIDPEAALVNPAVDASRRLGPLSMGSRAHVTDTNPDGEVRQCNRRDLHDSHEYQAEFGAYFNVYCPGNVGSQR
jgi:hypothetical protein